MLKMEGVWKTFNAGTVNEKTALSGLSLELKEGDFVTVIGGNGAGKSTMLNAIAGVWAVDSGRMILDGEDITALPEHKRAKLIGRVFQDPMMGTAPNMQLEENLALIAHVERVKVEGCAFLMAASRKRVTGAVCGNPPFEQRLPATLAAHTAAILGGADMVRVHDVKEAVQAANMADALRQMG